MEGLYLIISALIGAFATIASVLISKKNKKSNKDPILSETQNNQNIYSALEYVMEEMGSDRAYVLQFHNGGYYISGRSQQKFSCTHEICSPGISRECDNSQNHVISNFHQYINELTQKGQYSYLDCENVPDKLFAAMMKNKGIQSIYNVPIKTLSGNIIGILGVDYIKECADTSKKGFCSIEQKESFSEETRQFMRSQARVISGYLI